jgi:hypothetical protein
MKASRKVIRQMTKTYEPKKAFGSGGFGKVGKTVLKKRQQGKKKP